MRGFIVCLLLLIGTMMAGEFGLAERTVTVVEFILLVLLVFALVFLKPLHKPTEEEIEEEAKGDPVEMPPRPCFDPKCFDKKE